MARLRSKTGTYDQGILASSSAPSAAFTGQIWYNNATGVTLAANLTSQVRIASTMNVPADDSLVLIDKPIYLMEADVLRGGASAASTLELFASYEVINDA